MRLSRVYVAFSLQENTEYMLVGENAHYLNSVLRVRDGTPLTLFNGEGGQFEAYVERVRKGQVKVRTVRYEAIERESRLAIIFGYSVCRGPRSDSVVQKATELGVVRIDPLQTERTVVRVDPSRAGRRVAHWHSIAVQACEQCGRNRVPEVSSISQIADWLIGQPNNTSRLVFDRSALRSVNSIARPTGPVVVLAGPEGGLTPTELALAEASGFSAVHLGPRTMRADTAAIAGLVALQLQFGDLS